MPEPAPPSATAASSVLRDLRENPFEFEFDAAVAILRRASAHSADPAAIRFEAATGLAFASSDVLSVRGGPDDAFRVVTGFLGLTGPAGALPRTYTEHVVAERRQRSSALADFLDMVAQRPATQFAAAAMKYRPHRIREEAALAAGRGDALRDTLLSLTGHAIPAVARGLGDAIEAVLHHAGAFAAHPRSADRLGAILSDWFGRTVTVQQFAGRWIRIGREEQSRMPWGDGGGRFHRLGVDAAVGTAAWDIQSTVILRVGPLSLREFESFLPGGPSLAALRALASAYLDDAVAFAVKPVLAAAEVPPLRMPRGSTAPSARLGQNTWLTTGAPRREDAEDTVVRSEP
ncbi:MAG: type VI secretion system baseplate subunit TssG [Gluconacetobacter diazotrophicus]|nr:type VI secretion system baseplate subunit TssG [Gluconacetobacter diazotrophicus]